MKEYNLPILLLCFGVARTAWFPAERKKIISDCLIKMELCLTPMLEALYKDWHPTLQLILTHLFWMLADLRKKKIEYLTFTAKEPSIDSAWYQEMNGQVNSASVPQYKRGHLNFMHAKCASNGSVFSKIYVLNTSNDDIKTCINIYRLTQPPILTCKVFYTMDVLRIHTATTP